MDVIGFGKSRSQSFTYVHTKGHVRTNKKSWLASLYCFDHRTLLRRSPDKQGCLDSIGLCMYV
jgi:hypothetical protein